MVSLPPCGNHNLRLCPLRHCPSNLPTFPHLSRLGPHCTRPAPTVLLGACAPSAFSRITWWRMCFFLVHFLYYPNTVGSSDSQRQLFVRPHHHIRPPLLPPHPTLQSVKVTSSPQSPQPPTFDRTPTVGYHRPRPQSRHCLHLPVRPPMPEYDQTLWHTTIQQGKH